MSPAGRAQFPLGCCVRFNALARASFRFSRDVPATVVGYGRSTECVWLVRDGNTSRERWAIAFLERLEEGARMVDPTPLLFHVWRTACAVDLVTPDGPAYDHRGIAAYQAAQAWLIAQGVVSAGQCLQP